MALALTIKKGEIVQVGDRIMTLENVSGEDAATISFNDEAGVYDLGAEALTDVGGGVRIGVGSNRNIDVRHYTRLRFDAPRSITILRQQLILPGLEEDVNDD